MEAEIVQKLEDMAKGWEAFKHAKDTLDAEVKKLGREDVVLKEAIDKAANDVSKIHEELTAKFAEISKFGETLESLETKFNRLQTEESSGEESKEEKANAADFVRTKLLRRNQLMPGQSLPEDFIDQYRRYSKALPLYIRYGEQGVQVEVKDLQVGNDQDGGYFVRPQWSSRITKLIYESSPIRQLATVESISGPEMKYPIDNDEADCGWVGERQARPATNTPQVQEKSIIAHEMYAMPKATQTILEDAGIDVEGWLMGKVGEKMSRVEATAFVSGDGVAKPRGLLSYPDGTSWGQVQQIGSGSSGAFDTDKLIDLVASLKEPFHPNARFIIRRETIAKLMQLKDGDNRYIFQPIFMNGFNNIPLLGYPITYAADMPAVAAGAMAMIFGDIRAAYTVVDRVGMSMLRDPFSFKPFVAFYTRRRVGGDVLNFEAYKIHKLA